MARAELGARKLHPKCGVASLAPDARPFDGRRRGCARSAPRHTLTRLARGAADDLLDDTARLTTIGPYRIHGILGRGGMGVVYRGEDAENGAPVAVKTLHSRSQTPLASIRREIHALERLHHPGVVRIVGHGVAEGVPWYAMDLLVGRTLRDILAGDVELRSRRGSGSASQWTTQTKEPSKGVLGAGPRIRRISRRPSDRARSLAVVLRCCQALSYMHAMGVVHRDLKPENIFVREDGTPVLVDLGLAATFAGQRGREQLDLIADVLGTVAYMAPEQVRGQLVDARADLYALGCILYECIAGEPPFAGVPSFAVLDAHLRTRPLPPSQVADDVPPALDELVLRLLEKQPHDRIGYAEDVARALHLHVRDVPRLASSTRRNPYLYRPPFVGRDSAMRELNGAIGQVGSGGRVYIAGESGVGKTRLVLEALNQARWRGVSIVLSQCGLLGVGGDAVSSDRPLHAFAPALLAVADYCRGAGVAESMRLLGESGKVLAPYEPSLEQVPGYAALPDPPPLGPREARARVLSALEDVLHAFAAVRPLVVAIDDLQWADELSLGFLARPLARSGPLLVVATYRADEASSALREVVRAAGARHIELDRFGLEAVGAMVRGMLALDAPPAGLVPFLQRKCNGNPFFVVCYLQAAVGERLLAREEDGRWKLGGPKDAFDLEGTLPVPAQLTSLVELRLRQLAAAPRRVVDAGAVLGREFDGELLLVCADLAGSGGLDTLQTLRERQILEEVGNGELRFVHDRIRETAYEQMPRATAADLHRRAARAIEAQDGGQPKSSQVLAEHFSRGGLHNRAATYFDWAGDFAAAVYINGDALRCYRSAVRELSLSAQPPPDVSAAQLLEKIGDIMAVTGEHAPARSSYEEALRDPGGPPIAEARLHRKIGKTWEAHHDHAGALRSYARGADILGQGGVARDTAWWHEVIQVTIERLWVHYWLNGVQQMELLIAQSSPVVEEHGTSYQRARFVQLVAMRNIRRERYLVSDDTVALARKALTIAQGHTDAERAALRFVLFFALYLREALEEAEREGHSVLEWAERAGAATLRIRTLTYLTTAARKRGDLERVKKLVGETLRLCEPSSSSEKLTGLSGYYPGALHANLAWIAWRENRPEETERYGRSALESWKSERDPYPFQWLARFPLMAAAAARGDTRTIEEHAAALLSPEQQQLPESLAAEVGAQLSRLRERREAFDPAAILQAASRCLCL